MYFTEIFNWAIVWLYQLVHELTIFIERPQ